MSDVTEFGPSSGVLAVRVLINEADAIVKEDLFYARQVNPQFQIDTQTYEGNEQTQTQDKIRRVDIEITCGKLDLVSLARIFGKTPVLAPDDELAWYVLWGDVDEEAGILAGVEYDLPFTDESVSPYVAGTLRRTFHHGVLKARRLPESTFNTPNTTLLHFTADRSTVDILGDTISGVVGNKGVFYSEGMLL